MPKPTFENLPEAKRARIVRLAIEEFSERTFREASLSRIVARARIAKGSIYQYFDDKLDLYRWLLTDELPRRKLAHLQTAAAAAPPANLGDMLRGAVLSGLEFFRDNPRLAQLASQASMPTSDPELAGLFSQMREAGHTGFVAMLGQYAEAGDLRQDVDLDLAARIIASVLAFGLRDLVQGHLGVDLMELMRDPDSARDALARSRLEPIVDATVSLLLQGLAPRGSRTLG